MFLAGEIIPPDQFEEHRILGILKRDVVGCDRVVNRIIGRSMFVQPNGFS